MGRRRGAARWTEGAVFLWVRRRSTGVKLLLGAAAAILPMAALWFLVHDRSHFFVAAEAAHAVGLLILVYKLARRKSCSGLSLKSQELTALYLAIRLYTSFVYEKDVHTFLDGATLAATLWVIYMMRIKLKHTYLVELDNMQRYKLVVPCILLALVVHPLTAYLTTINCLWAFSVYLESIAVLPQLRLMQNAKMVEPFTGHYVFALGIARFLSGAFWIIQVIDSRGAFLFHIGHGFFWIPAVLIAEIIQTFILADFCYYYIKNSMYDQLLTSIEFSSKPAA